MSLIEGKLQTLTKKNNLFNKSRHNLNNSKSLVKTSATNNLATDNKNLAKALGLKEQELLEIKKENIKLLQNNYELNFNHKFRQNNYNDFLRKYYDLAGAVQNAFDSICKLSEELMEIKNHPFLVPDPYDNEVNETQGPLNDSNQVIPTPFLSRDKIPRSPIKELNESKCVENLQVSQCINDLPQIDKLAARVDMIKNQSNHSVHNLSIDLHKSNSSFKHGNSFFNSHKQVDPSKCEVTPVTPKFIEIPKSEGKVLCQNKESLNKLSCSFHNVEGNVLEKPKIKKTNTKPVNKKRKPRKKMNLQLKLDKPSPNKDEYIKKKEEDAYYLSFNETANATIVPSTLNEFKNQQINEVNENQNLKIKENNQGNLDEIYRETNDSSSSDDIIMGPSRKVIKSLLDDSVIEIDETEVKKSREKDTGRKEIDETEVKKSREKDTGRKLKKPTSQKNEKPTKIPKSSHKKLKRPTGQENEKPIEIAESSNTKSSNERQTRSRRNVKPVNYTLQSVEKKKRRID